MGSVSWKAHCDDDTQRPRCFENGEWHEWRHTPRRNGNMVFKRTGSTVENGRGIPGLTHVDGNHRKTSCGGEHGAEEVAVKLVVNPHDDKVKCDENPSLSENLK